MGMIYLEVKKLQLPKLNDHLYTILSLWNLEVLVEMENT